jgi:hypothetical protein
MCCCGCHLLLLAEAERISATAYASEPAEKYIAHPHERQSPAWLDVLSGWWARLLGNVDKRPDRPGSAL